MAHKPYCKAAIGGRGQAESRRGRASIGASVSKTLYKTKTEDTKTPETTQRFGTLRHISKWKVPTTILTRNRRDDRKKSKSSSAGSLLEGVIMDHWWQVRYTLRTEWPAYFGRVRIT